MTSTELPQGADFEVEDRVGEESEGSDGPVTPWSERPGHKQGRPRLGAPVPPAPTSPIPPGGASPQGRNETPLGAPGQPKVAPGGPGVGGAPAQAAPTQPAPPAAASPAPPAPESAAAPAGRETRYREPEPPESLINPDMIGAALPAAAMAGTMAMAALPMIANALAGLAGGNGQGNNGGGDTTNNTELSPESQQALEALELLAKVYGEEETDDPEIQAIRKELGLVPGDSTDAGGAGGGGTGGGGGGAGSTGTGETANAVNARQLFQRNAATAFNNIDNQLLRYITGLAGNNKVDQKAIGSLVREVNVALAQLGPQAYTAQGQQKVRQILTAALQKAHTIVSGSNTNSTDTANAINQLTNQYLYNIAGQNYTAATGTSGGQMPGTGATAAAQRAIQVALAQTGKPYVLGDEGPNSFDCSGLMQYSAAAAGVQIPRVSEDQYRLLPQVNPAAIRPGDLIFPSDSFKSSGLPGHVIMYIGNGMCIAASKPGVPIGTVPLPSSYLATRWTN
ncbi:DUF4226 domain-containing protein [Nocardia sp. NPDC051463]|uniref:C40 family peptidase n=1 Tax=Nocardia sp. NPDC051463 TaxID=3154845 RepID=UPI0034491D4D